MSRPHWQSPWLGRSENGLKNLHFQQGSMCCWRYWSGDYTLKSHWCGEFAEQVHVHGCLYLCFSPLESWALWSLITLQCMSPIFPGLDGYEEKMISKSKEKVIKKSFQYCWKQAEASSEWNGKEPWIKFLLLWLSLNRHPLLQLTFICQFSKSTQSNLTCLGLNDVKAKEGKREKMFRN